MLTASGVLLAVIALIGGVILIVGGAVNDHLPGWCTPLGVLLCLGVVAGLVYAVYNAQVYGVVQ